MVCFRELIDSCKMHVMFALPSFKCFPCDVLSMMLEVTVSAVGMTHCEDSWDQTEHPVGSTWVNSGCQSCSCGEDGIECCDKYVQHEDSQWL